MGEEDKDTSTRRILGTATLEPASLEPHVASRAVDDASADGRRRAIGGEETRGESTGIGVEADAPSGTLPGAGFGVVGLAADLRLPAMLSEELVGRLSPSTGREGRRRKKDIAGGERSRATSAKGGAAVSLRLVF